MNKKLLFAIGILVFLFFVWFSYLVHKDLFSQFDFDTTVRLQDNISRRFDLVFSWFSLSGSFEVTGLILLIILFLRKKLSGIFILFLFLAIHIIELYGKVFVEHLGPPFMFFRYNIPFLFPTSYVKPGYSYPSGHSSRTLFITVLIAIMLLRSKRFSPAQKIIIILAMIVFDFAMLVSRVYLGEHWTSDVLGGGLLGVGLGLISSLALF